MRTLIVLMVVGLFTYSTFGQEYTIVEKSGMITYMSSQNVYVKFDNTAGISAGDSLFEKQSGKLIPVVIVRHISSTSCAGELLNGKKLKLNDLLFAKAKLIEEKEIIPDDTLSYNLQLSDTLIERQQTNVNNRIIRSKPSFSGRISAQSYTNLTNYDKRGEYQRWRYTLSLNANEIARSSFSVSTYTSFSYRADQWNSVTDNLGRSLRVYDLSVNYKFNETTNLWAGRHLNRKITNISSIDGIQFEKYFDENYFGIIAGSRPNFSDMGWNSKLFQFGGYYGRTDSVNGSLMENTIGVVQQTNNFKTDRRFIYLQHNNSILPKVNLFLSSEIDLYKKILEKESNEFILTSLYTMIRYSPSRIFSISGSYDARKNVIYYETFKNFIDSVFENETRQGATLRMNLNPVDYLYVGLGGGYRNSKNDLRPSKNYNGYVTYSRIPFAEISATLSYNNISSSYVDGSIYGFRITKSINELDAELSLGCRRTNYTYIINSNKVEQDNVNIDCSIRIIDRTYFNIGYEGYFEKNNSQGRILIDLTTRF
ncbi:MAG: hypothetical protein IPM56_03500 [Ignavibacteriales bacterium]|nr:MAG: hypothetical protein IPM56_03500 [Ignavibacteriales bacterium]